MTVEAVIQPDIYDGNGATRNWAITFAVTNLATADIAVYVETNGVSALVTTGVEVDLTTPEVVYPTVASGLNVLTSAQKLIIKPVLPLKQEFIDVDAQGAIPLPSIESGFDRVILILQQMQEEINRCAKSDIAGGTLDNYISALQTLASSAENAETSAAESAATAVQAAADAVEAAEAAEAFADWEVTSQANAEGLTNNTELMTPLRTGQSIAAYGEANFLTTPEEAPDADYEVANKKYVDDKGFGAYETTDASQVGGTGDTLTVSTVYQANVDGFVAASSNGNATDEIMTIYIEPGDSSPDVMIQSNSHSEGVNGAVCVFGAVAKGEYWSVVYTGSGSINAVRFKPLS